MIGLTPILEEKIMLKINKTRQNTAEFYAIEDDILAELEAEV